MARRPEGISLAQLSAELDLRSSTAFHLIQTLVGLGFLTQLADTRRYRIGTPLFTLAAGALDETALLFRATPILERLSAETGHAAHLAVPSMRSSSLPVSPRRPCRNSPATRAPLVLPTQPPSARCCSPPCRQRILDRLLKTLPLPAFTPHTLTDAASLRREIDVVRRTGLAHDNCELDADVRCIAVPVHDFAGRCAAAMGLSGPVWRLTPHALNERARQLAVAAAELFAQLGHRIPGR